MSRPTTAEQPASLPYSEVARRGLDAFAELGYEQTTVRELARRIGVSHNFINDRYGSKLAFWRAAVDYASAQLEPIIVPSDAELDDAQQLSRIISRYYRNVARHPAIHRLLWDEASRDTERLDYLIERHARANIDVATPVLERLVEAGRIAPTPIHLLWFAIFGPSAAMVQGPLARRIGRPLSTDAEQLEKYADTMARHVIAGVIAPIADQG